MKNLKKLASIALILVLALAMMTTAFAAPRTTGSITVNGAQAGETYTPYKIFDLSYGGSGVVNENPDAEVNGSNDPHSYSILSTSPWFDFVNVGGEGAAYVTLTASTEDVGTGVTKYFVAWNGNAAAADFAAKAMAYANDPSHNVAAAAASATPAAGSTTVKFDNLPLGYYLIDSTMGALCSLDTTNFDANVTEKNPTTELTKKIDVDGVLVDSNTANIGDTITYDIEVKIQPGATNYVVHDQMEAGLTITADSVFIQGLTSGTDYTVNYAPTDSHTFDVTFTEAYLNGISAETTVHIRYSAVLNENATIGDADTNDNSAHLTYGQGSETPPSTVETATYGFKLVKTNGSNVILNGAEFKLYDAATEGNEIPVVSVSEGVYRIAKEGETGVAIAAGNVTINGLKDGTYYLEETVAPTGYNKLATRTVVTVSNESATSEVETTTADEVTTYVSGGVQVINQTGTELPSTGGIGTTIFYIVGGLLVVGACILLITKKRVKAD